MVAEEDNSLEVVDIAVAAIVLVVVARAVAVDIGYQAVVGMVLDCRVDSALLILSTSSTMNIIYRFSFI